MEDQFAKYLRLFGTLFLTFVSFIIALVLLCLGVRLFFGILSYIPWVTYLYVIFILIVPAALFISVYIIYAGKTRAHPSLTIRIVSYIIFSIALLAWIVYFTMDMIIFFRHAYVQIEKYHSYDMIFLASNVACIFFIGVMQALTAVKEKDWMDRNRDEK